MKQRTQVELALYIRAALPSTLSLTGSLIAGSCIVVGHMLVLGENAGTLLPKLFGSLGTEAADMYNKYIHHPLQEFLQAGIMSTLFVAVAWALAGLAAFTLIGFVMQTLKEAHRSEQEVGLSSDGTLRQHPLRRIFMTTFLWRMGVAMVALLFTVFSHSWIQRLLDRDNVILHAGDPLLVAMEALLSVLSWMVIAHIYVVLLRLFLLRTRVFGELPGA